MGRQGGTGDHPTMVSSSIALLQERFRQLQKVRERREEKELLKLFSESERVVVSSSSTPTMRYDQPNRLPFQSDQLIQPYRQPLQDSLSLGLNSSQSWQTDYRAMAIPDSTSLWPNTAATSSTTSKNFDYSDVDTSLHL
ncbi:hypothetical protein COLO4_08493 [Corchorus olitorius]|uniref:Uncharacterized protein n=1 Tax=Corchorus olitorius TaxID=93759 RepID=A0A1R3KFI9_9ROSI|nr:hypothetical protein COLO4_08493 [Corchorus olitorius]